MGSLLAQRQPGIGRGRAMSETSIALISAGSALAASLVTGSLTWLAGRSVLARQLVEQREVRTEQHRREVYTACMELFSSWVTWQITLATRRARQETPDRIQEAGAMVGDITKSLFRHTAAIELAGPEPVVAAFNAAKTAVSDWARALDRVSSEDLVAAGEESPHRLVWAEFDVATDAVRDFTNVARRMLQPG
ncbi:hypothetical protein [Streptomyces griseoflavus]|uniref:hypothetical protein n=1 Tax=Streptomyces griseoflavus TaxID=35619 RepID=UPI0033C07D1E